MRSGDVLLMLLVALLGTGVVAVQSAGLGVTDTLTPMNALGHRMVLLAAGAVGAFLIGGLVPTRWLARPWIVWTAIACTLALVVVVLVPGVGRQVNGARRWLDIGPIGFQPSELAKWIGVLFTAAACTWWTRRLGTFKGLLLVLLPTGLLALLVLKEDLGTAVLMLAVAAGLVLAAGAKLWHLAVLAPVGCVGLAGAIAIEPYRVQRLQAFMDPFADPTGSGYHVIQSMAAIAGGGPGGRGLGNGIQKYGYLPEDTTDFIFSIICEEAGIGGGLLVVCLLMALVLAGWSVLKATSSTHARLLCLGILLTIGLQAVMNLLVVTGLAPTKGIALPLVSSGGTGWLMTAFALGWIRGIDRQTSTLETTQAHAQTPHPA